MKLIVSDPTKTLSADTGVINRQLFHRMNFYGRDEAGDIHNIKVLLSEAGAKKLLQLLAQTIDPLSFTDAQRKQLARSLKCVWNRNSRHSPAPPQPSTVASRCAKGASIKLG